MSQATDTNNNKHVFVCQYPSETNPPKPKRKRSRKPVRFYAWQGNADQLIEGQYSSSGDFVFMPGGAYSEGHYINAKLDADFCTIATFKKSWHYETLESGRKVRQTGRQKRFLHTLHACFLDIDSSLPLSEDVILQRCRAYNLPEPTHIVCTSPGHYQLHWVYQKPLILNTLPMFNYWKLVQRGLHAMFKDMDSDSNVASDATRYLRNPHKKNATNFKYEDMPEVKLVYQGGTTSLTKLYNALKKHGFIEQSIEFPKQKKFKRLGNGVPLTKVLQFIKANPDYTGSYEEVSAITGVSIRAIHYLREKKLIKVSRLRVGKIYKIRLNSSDCTNTLYKEVKHFSLSSFSNQYQLVIKKFNSNGLNEGFRNMGVFAFSLYLNCSGKSMSEILKMLTPGLEKCQSSGRSFTQEEITKTINSACREEYRFYYNPRGEIFQKLLAELGNDVLQLEKIPIERLKRNPKVNNKISLDALVNTGLTHSKGGNLKGKEPRKHTTGDAFLEFIRQKNIENYGHKFYKH